jgi:hypothetical protein
VPQSGQLPAGAQPARTRADYCYLLHFSPQGAEV